MKRNLLGIVLLCLSVMLFASIAFAEIKNPDTIISVTTNGPVTIDPHWGYDGTSMEVDRNVYDNLINYKGENISEFVPMLATEVPSVENGLIKDNGLTYIFPIRKDVKFHNGDILTPEDVAYSIKRALIFDRAGGPVWMLLEPLLATSSIEKIAVELAGVENYSDLFENGDPRGELKPDYKDAMVRVVTDYVDKAVEVDENNVIFHLAQAYTPFLNILTHPGPWGAIINKKWSIEQGAWDGQADTWWKYHDPENEKDPLYAIENGTGPFVLKKWVPEEIVMLERFDDYWQGPAKIKSVQIKVVKEWTTRKLMLQTGDADVAHGLQVPVQYLSEVKKIEGVRVIEDLPTLIIEYLMFPWTIDAGSPNIGSGKLDGKGIPPDFFSDVHVRRGFLYLFPYDIFISKITKGQAIRASGPIPKGLLGFSDDPSLYYNFSLLKAAEEFKLAWDGELWEKGCEFNIFYIEGGETRKAAIDMLATYAKMINPKFKLTPVGLVWSAFLKAMLTERLPIYAVNWGADYADPHNFAPVFMNSTGTLSGSLGKAYREFAEKNVDPLTEKALRETDLVKRAEIYKKLLKIAHDQAISLYLYQPIRYFVERTWVKGYYYIPIGGGIDYYPLSKGE